MQQHPLVRFRYCPACGHATWIEQNPKAKHCTHCGFTFYANASSAVAVFICNQQGLLLVCRRKKDPAAGTLDLPGGFVDIGETAEEAVRREIHEELNLQINDIHYLFSIPNVYEYSAMNIHTLDLFYQCSVDSFDNLRAADDVSDAFFADLNTIFPDDFGLNSIKKGIIAFLKRSEKVSL